MVPSHSTDATQSAIALYKLSLAHEIRDGHGMMHAICHVLELSALISLLHFNQGGCTGRNPVRVVHSSG